MSLDRILAGAADIRAGRHKPAGSPVVVPLAGFYRRSDEAERRRCKMYSDMAIIFGFDGWRDSSRDFTPLKAAGGKRSVLAPGNPGRQVQHYGDRRKATFRNNMAHPLEFFEGNINLLKPPARGKESDQQMAAAHALGLRRVRLARVYHETKVSGESSGVKSVDLERVSSTGFGPGSISDHQISCMQDVARWESAMPESVRRTMQKTLYEGVFAFMPLGTEDSNLCLTQIRMGLDIIAERENEISQRDLFDAWPGLDLMTPGKGRTRSGSR